jgi:hypothetical protein
VAIITREKLYDEIWSEPMTTVAERYEVSSNYLARICERLSIPRPGRGYWQQLAAGKLVEREPLPKPDPGDETVWTRGADGVYHARPIGAPTFTGPGERGTKRGQRPKTHPLLVGVREDFLDSKPRRYDEHGYLVPKRSALPDIFVSKDVLTSAIALANRLYLELEDRGHWVREAAVHGYRRPMLEHREGAGAKPQQHDAYASRIWSSARPTLVYIGGVAIGLVIFEIAEEAEVMRDGDELVRVPQTKAIDRLRQAQSWRFFHRWLPSGRLALQAYSPYGRASWERYWRESKRGDLNRMFSEVAQQLETAAPEIAKLEQEAERKAEEEHQRYLAAERERRRKELEELRVKTAAESREQLLDVIESWVTACHVERFFQELNQRREALSDDERATIDSRIERARALFGGGADATKHFRRWKAPEEVFAKAKKDLWWSADDP